MTRELLPTSDITTRLLLFTGLAVTVAAMLWSLGARLRICPHWGVVRFRRERAKETVPSPNASSVQPPALEPESAAARSGTRPLPTEQDKDKPQPTAPAKDAWDLDESPVAVAEEEKIRFPPVPQENSLPLISVGPKRTQLQTPDSGAMQKELARLAPRMLRSHSFLDGPAKHWSMGIASIKGNVRAENQDRGVCFRIGEYDVLVLADGCGGCPHGGHAAYVAVMGAAMTILRTWEEIGRWRSPACEHICHRAFTGANHALAMAGDKLNVTNVSGGLRTTLIVIINGPDTFHYGYIGDGGGYVMRASGNVESFLDPQKEDGAPNILSSSLGPAMEGEPVFGAMARRAGDLVIAGSDGVFDRVPASFCKDVLRGCIQFSGDLQAVAEKICGELAEQQDSAGYICDDNMTLAVVGSGEAPRLRPGFWHKSRTRPGVNHDHSRCCLPKNTGVNETEESAYHGERGTLQDRQQALDSLRSSGRTWRRGHGL